MQSRTHTESESETHLESSSRIIPAGVLATSPKVNKLVAERQEAKVAVRASALKHGFSASNFVLELAAASQPMSAAVRVQALNVVREDLVKNQVLDVDKQVGAALRQELEFEFSTSIPTPGIVVKGCLDECNTCEPSRRREIELELERLSLQNKLLARQIELLEQVAGVSLLPARYAGSLTRERELGAHGKTSHLFAAQLGALVAFMQTL